MQIYVGRGGQRLGPFSLEQVKEKMEDGLFSPSDLGWHEGCPNWVSLSVLLGDAQPQVMTSISIIKYANMRIAFWLTTVLCALIGAVITFGTVEVINERFDGHRERLGLPRQHSISSGGAAVGSAISAFIFPLLGLAIGAHWAKKTGEPIRHKSLRYWCGIGGAILAMFGAGILIIVAWPVGCIAASSMNKRTQSALQPPLSTTPLVDTSKRYFVFIAGQVKGPYSFEQLRSLRDFSAITDQTQCCLEGTEQWSTWSFIIAQQAIRI